MINFGPKEFNAIWDTVSGEVGTKWNVGRGRKSSFKGKDVLFMMLTVLKHSGQWEFLGKIFKIKGPTFENMIVGYMNIVVNVLVKVLVTQVEEKWPMSRCIEEKRHFQTFKYARYATDVTFQVSNRPTGNLAEGKLYFSRKHKLYGYKMEVSVLPNGLAIGFTKHYPGSVADIDIFYKNQDFHAEAMEKTEDEKDVMDTFLFADTYPNDWAILVDKGYQGSAEYMRAIHPHRKPVQRSLSREKVEFNRQLASDRIIVENFFGRLSSLWAVLSNKYRWSEGMYDMIFGICVSLTNYHIQNSPLRAEDHDFYEIIRSKHYTVGEEQVRKRKRTQQNHKAKRKSRIEMQFRHLAESDDDMLSVANLIDELLSNKMV